MALSVPPPKRVSSRGGGSSQTSTAFDDHDHQKVDTTLRLAPPYYFSRKSPSPNNPPPLRWFLPGFFDGVENDVVDTTLRLCPPGTVIHPKKPQNSDISPPPPPPPPPVVYDATPLRWFYSGADFSPADASTIKNTIKNSRNYSNNKGKGKVDVAKTGGGDDKGKKKRMRSRHDDEASTSAFLWKKKKRRRRGSVDEENQRPVVPIEEMGGLLRAVEARGESRPEFLYRKKLEMSDVKKNQNRVFLRDGERMVEFLREEEATAVLDPKEKKGIRIVGVDGGGRVYEKLVLKVWPSVEMLLINSGWNAVIAANKVEKDDVMEIWGYRENGKPCLVFNFMREREERDRDGGDNPSSSNSVIKKIS